MIPEYQKLIKDLKRALTVYRYRLLLFKLISGGVIVGGTFLFFICLFSFVGNIFNLTVFWRTVFYYFFLAVLILETLLFVIYPVVLSIVYSCFKNNLLIKHILSSSVPTSDVVESVYNLAF